MKAMRSCGVVALLVVAAGSAVAENANQRVVGKKGIGYFNSAAPFGTRYWMNDGMAFDLGLGVGYENQVPVPGSTNNATTSDFDIAVDVGLPLVLHGEENMIVYFRPGVVVAADQQFDLATPTLDDKKYATNVSTTVSLGGEFFLGQLGWPNLSFAGQIGLGLEFSNPGGSGSKTAVKFVTTADDVNVVSTGTLGFHIYF
jgi:hypothetical protein